MHLHQTNRSKPIAPICNQPTCMLSVYLCRLAKVCLWNHLTPHTIIPTNVSSSRAASYFNQHILNKAKNKSPFDGARTEYLPLDIIKFTHPNQSCNRATNLTFDEFENNNREEKFAHISKPILYYSSVYVCMYRTRNECYEKAN